MKIYIRFNQTNEYTFKKVGGVFLIVIFALYMMNLDVFSD